MTYLSATQEKDYLDSNGKEIPGNVISVIKNLFDKQGVSYWIDQKERVTEGRFFRYNKRTVPLLHLRGSD